MTGSPDLGVPVRIFGWTVSRARRFDLLEA